MRGGAPARRRRDRDEVGALVDRRAELAQLRRHRGEAVGLLDAPAGDVASARVVPSANRPCAASVIAASGMWLQSSVDRRSGKRAAPDLEPSRRRRRRARPSRAPRRRSGCRPGSSRARRLRCATARRPRRARRRRRSSDADEASPSTWMRAGRAQRAAARGTWKRCQPSRCDGDAEARQQVQRDLDVGLRDQLAFDLDRRCRRCGDAAAAPAAAR